jgi:hypothetical protein
MACKPSFFEQLVVDLLLAMGYGGSRKDVGKAVGLGNATTAPDWGRQQRQQFDRSRQQETTPVIAYRSSP